MPITDDDFFKQLAGNQPAPKTPSKDEIVFRDEAGKMKVLKGEEVFDFDRLDIPAPKKEIIKEVFPQAKTEIKEIKPSESLKKEVIAMPGLALALDFDRAANEVIKKSGLKSDDPEKIKRLKNVIVSRLRNIRDQMEVREILADSPLAGGLGFDPAVVEKILNLTGEEARRRESLKENRPSPSIRSLDELFLPLALKTEAKREDSQPLKPLPVRPDFPQKSAGGPFELKPLNQPLVYPVNEKKPAGASGQGLAQAEKKESADLAAEIPTPLQPINKKLPEAPKTEVLPLAETKVKAKKEEKPEDKKPKPKAVKFQERLVDPAAEIETMKLVDFRRLGKTAGEAAAKILEKIALLEKDSFSKKVQGIKAWKANEVYRLYLEIARQSIAENKSMTEAANARKQAGLAVLTEDELAAVIELNQKLRY